MDDAGEVASKFRVHHGRTHPHHPAALFRVDAARRALGRRGTEHPQPRDLPRAISGADARPRPRDDLPRGQGARAASRPASACHGTTGSRPLASIVVTGYVVVRYPVLVTEISATTPDRWVLGGIAVVLVLRGDTPDARLDFDLARGRLYSLRALLALDARHLQCAQFRLGASAGAYLYLDTNSMLGLPLTVMAEIVIAFILFGRVLYAMNADKFLTDAALATDGPLSRRPGQGGGRRIEPVWHDLRQRRIQCRHGRADHDSHDDPLRLRAAGGRGDRGRRLHRRTDHAAGDGDHRVPDRRLAQHSLWRGGRRRDPAGDLLLRGAVRAGRSRSRQERAGRAAARAASRASAGAAPGMGVHRPDRGAGLHADRAGLGTRPRRDCCGRSSRFRPA